MTLAASMTCVGFLFVFQCNEKPPAQPEPQKIVCSFPRSPNLTAEEKAATPQRLRRYVLKIENKLNAGNCPKAVAP